MILVENTKENRELQQVVTTMALEGMYLNKDFVCEMLKVSKGEKTTEQLRQEVLKKYTNNE